MTKYHPAFNIFMLLLLKTRSFLLPRLFVVVRSDLVKSPMRANVFERELHLLNDSMKRLDKTARELPWAWSTYRPWLVRRVVVESWATGCISKLRSTRRRFYPCRQAGKHFFRLETNRNQFLRYHAQDVFRHEPCQLAKKRICKPPADFRPSHSQKWAINRKIRGFVE